jgi:hypothetical protein
MELSYDECGAMLNSTVSNILLHLKTLQIEKVTKILSITNHCHLNIFFVLRLFFTDF